MFVICFYMVVAMMLAMVMMGLRRTQMCLFQRVLEIQKFKKIQKIKNNRIPSKLNSGLDVRAGEENRLER